MKKQNISQPRDDEQKNEGWFLRWQQYQWGLYENGFTGIGINGNCLNGRSISELRAYSRGRQEISKYMEILDPSDEDGKNVLGISWDTLKMASNKFAIAKRRIRMVDFKAGTEGTDSFLGEKRTRVKARMKAKLDPRFMQMSKFAGLDYGMDGFNNKEDVEDYASMGLLVLEEEANMKDLIDKTEDVSGFDVLKDMIVDDLIEAYMMAIHVKTVNNKVCYNYIDIDRLVHRRSVYPDCRDIDFAGYWEEITISQLRDETGWEEKQLKEVAQKASRTTSVNTVSSDHSTGREDHYRNTAWYDQKVKVFKSYWLASDAEDYIAGIYTPTGGRIFRRKPDNYEKRKYSDVDEVTVNVHNVWRSNWVVGTNYVYGFGKEEYPVRDGGYCMLPIRIWQSDKPSSVEACIPVIDQIQLEWNSIQNFLAKLPPAPRMVWDQALLEEFTSLGGKNRDPLYVAEKFAKTGRLFVRSINEHGDPSLAANRLPITPIELNIAQELAARMNYIVSLKQDLRELSGINEVADGTLNQNDMLVGVAENLDMATNMVLGQYVEAYKNFYRGLSRYAVKKWQQVLKYNDEVVGGKGGRQRNVGREMSMYDFDIRLNPVVTEKDKQVLMNYLVARKQENRVNEADFFIIYNMISEGDIKKAQFYLIKAVSRKEAEERAHQERMVMLQGQQVKEAGIASEQAKAQTEQVKQKGVEVKVGAEAQKELLVQREKNRGMIAVQSLKERQQV